MKLWIATTAIYVALVIAFGVGFATSDLLFAALFVVATLVAYVAGAAPLWKGVTQPVWLVLGGMTAIAVGNVLGIVTSVFGLPLTLILVVIGYLDLRRAAQVGTTRARAILVIAVPLVAFGAGFTLFGAVAAAVAALLALFVVYEVAPRRQGRAS